MCLAKRVFEEDFQGHKFERTGEANIKAVEPLTAGEACKHLS